MRRALVFWTATMMGGLSAVALVPPTQSASGQFSVTPRESGGSAATSAPFLADADLLYLDASRLAVSADRIRQHLLRELQDQSPWQGRVLFSLRATGSFDAPVQMIAEWRSDGWRYRVSMPEYIAHDRFVRALVEVNLMEIANRTSSGRAVEVPAWLTEGLTAQLLASRSVELILPPPKLAVGELEITPWVVEERTYQPLALARSQLSTNVPLSIEQLSWPAPGTLRGRRGEMYRHCSHLLCTRLVQLPSGHELLNQFIRRLSQHYNWQVAFLQTYREQFPTLLDFEKWWALQVAHFADRELGASYPYLESVQRLKEAVRFPVQVRLATNDLPLQSDAPLQTIIREWERNKQRAALQQVHRELVLLRPRIAPELVDLLDRYRLILGSYLANRDRTGLYLPKGVNRQAALTRVIARTLRQLDRCDAELAALMPETPGPSALAGTPP